MKEAKDFLVVTKFNVNLNIDFRGQDLWQLNKGETTSHAFCGLVLAAVYQCLHHNSMITQLSVLFALIFIL